ncbi:MAG: NHLP bacteriocin system secretion protein [bacterium]
MGVRPLFRKVALDRLSSPEQLDQLTQVTNSKAWLSLGAVALVLLTGIVWSVVGSLPERVSGMGMLLKSGGVLEIVAPGAGRIADVSVDVGDTVREGQVIARVEQAALVDQLRQAKAVLASARAQNDQAATFNHRDSLLQSRLLAELRVSAQQSIASDQRTLAWLKDKIAAQEQLVKQGLLLKATLASSRQQFDQTEQKIAQAQSDLIQSESRLLGVLNQKQDQLRDGEVQVADAERKVESVTRDLTEQSEVVSPYSGRILEVMSDAGAIVTRGEPLLTLDMSGRTVKGLEAIIYVSPAHGKQIRRGMKIQIAPATVKQEEFGLMLGLVTYVSDFPATPRGMRRVLKNDQLITSLAGNTAPYEVHADLIVDPSTVSQFRWSSSKGPPLHIQSGTLATGDIEIASRRPVSMVLPLLRGWTGL